MEGLGEAGECCFLFSIVLGDAGQVGRLACDLGSGVIYLAEEFVLGVGVLVSPG